MPHRKRTFLTNPINNKIYQIFITIYINRMYVMLLPESHASVLFTVSQHMSQVFLKHVEHNVTTLDLIFVLVPSYKTYILLSHSWNFWYDIACVTFQQLGSYKTRFANAVLHSLLFSQKSSEEEQESRIVFEVVHKSKCPVHTPSKMTLSPVSSFTVRWL